MQTAATARHVRLCRVYDSCGYCVHYAATIPSIYAVIIVVCASLDIRFICTWKKYSEYDLEGQPGVCGEETRPHLHVSRQERPHTITERPRRVLQARHMAKNAIVIDLIGGDDELEIEALPPAKFRRTEVVVHVASPPKKATFTITACSLPKDPPFNKEVGPIHSCIKEIFGKSRYPLHLRWEYEDVEEYYKPVLTFTGKGSKIYTFQIVFQVSRNNKFYPHVPPRIVPQFILPAPMFVHVYNHPVLTSSHWNSSSSHSLIRDTLMKTLDYLEANLTDQAQICTSALPGDLNTARRGREWEALPADQLAIEFLIAELYGDYVGQTVDKNLRRLTRDWMDMVVVPVPKAARAKSAMKGASARGKGIGYSTGHTTVAVAAVEGRTAVLVDKIHSKFQGVMMMLRSQRRALSWLLESPLAEVLVAILQEFSREEVYRQNRQVVQIFNLVLVLELTMRDVWGKDVMDMTPIVDLDEPSAGETEGGPRVNNADGGDVSDECEGGDEEDEDDHEPYDRKAALYQTMAQLYAKLKWIEDQGLIAAESDGEWRRTIHSVSKIYSKVIGLRAAAGPSPVKKVTYTSDILTNHVFYRSNPRVAVSRAWVRELKFIEDNLPDEVALFVAEEHPNYLVVSMQMVNPDCPYYGGVFLFHVLIPANYPLVNPSVQLVTTGDGQVRFNPNLYKCGKVCLSLLGTWAGEPWNPKTSNVTQVLISILYLIFTEDPYFNEPGWQSTRNTPSGTQQSLCYDWEIYRSTIISAMLYHLQKPDSYYGEEVARGIRRYYAENWEKAIKPALQAKHATFSSQLPSQYSAQYPAAALNAHIKAMSDLVAAATRSLT